MSERSDQRLCEASSLEWSNRASKGHPQICKHEKKDSHFKKENLGKQVIFRHILNIQVAI